MLRSFRHRLALWHALIFTMILAAGGAIIFLGLREILLGKVDASLVALAETEAGSAFDDPEREVHLHEPVLDIASPDVGGIDKMVQIMDLSGEVVGRTRNLGGVVLPLSEEGWERVRKGEPFFETVANFLGEQIRIVSVPVRLRHRIKYVLQVGTPLDHVRAALNGILWLFVGFGGASLVLSTVSGFHLARKALLPIRRIADQARRIREMDLSRRLTPETSDTEVGNLIQVLNGMLSRLQAGVESQRHFLAGASHEIRSPLSLLKGEIEVALRRPRSVEEYRAVLRSNLEEVNRLSKLVQDLLTLARIDYGGIRLRRRRLALADVVAQEVERSRPQAHSRRQKIRMEETGRAVIEADEDLIRLLLDNLLDNALKYSPDGAEVCASVNSSDGFVRLAVKDNGPGIPPQDLDRVFERFYRCDRSRPRDPAGTGLGLSICKWIAEAHRGSITLQSREGEGSTFVVKIPCLPPS